MLHVFCSFSWEWLVFGGKTSVLPQREARRYKTDGRQKSPKLVSLDLSAQSRAGRMRISRSVQIFAPKDIRTSVAEIRLRCKAFFVCNIRWHCWSMKLSLSSWLFDLIGLFLNCCVCHIQPFFLKIAMILIKSKRVWRLIQTASWLTGKAVTL